MPEEKFHKRAERKDNWLNRNPGWLAAITIVVTIIAIIEAGVIAWITLIPQNPAIKYTTTGEPTIMYSIYGCKWANETKPLDDYLKMVCNNFLNVGGDLSLPQSTISQYVTSLQTGQLTISTTIRRISEETCSVSAVCGYSRTGNDVAVLTDTISVCINYANGTSTCHH